MMGRYKAVVIGSSVGGVQALSIILPLLPESFSVPVIIVQHRLSGSDDFLERHLDGLCQLNVVQAEANEKVIPGKIYIAPGGYHLMIELDHCFSLSIDAPVNYSIPSIDVLFESAADVYKKNIIGVVLTGANCDGSSGLKKIREMGGLAVVQFPETAGARCMPDSAIRLAGPDHIFTLDEIGSFLVCANND